MESTEVITTQVLPETEHPPILGAKATTPEEDQTETIVTNSIFVSDPHRQTTKWKG